jgi:hypothetical protein
MRAAFSNAASISGLFGDIATQRSHMLCTHVEDRRAPGHGDDVSTALGLACSNGAPDTTRCSETMATDLMGVVLSLDSSHHAGRGGAMRLPPTMR